MHLDRRLVVLVDAELHDGLRRVAARLGVPVAEVVRDAVRARVEKEERSLPDPAAAVAFLCAEHDPDFDWPAAKADLERRFDG